MPQFSEYRFINSRFCATCSPKDYIVNVHGFSESDDMMTILLEDEEHKHPTFSNITEAFKALSEPQLKRLDMGIEGGAEAG